MDKVSERERSSRKPRDDRERDWDAGKDHHRDRQRDRDRDGDHKHRHRHSEKHGEEKRHGSKDDKHHDDGRRSRADSLQDLEPRREPSSDRFGDPFDRSNDEKHRNGDRHRQSRADSPQYLEPKREQSSGHERRSSERFRDEKNYDGDLRHRSMVDSPKDPEPSRENFSDRSRVLVERSKDENGDHHPRSRVDSLQDLDLEQSSDRFKDSVEQFNDEKHHRGDRRHRSRADSPHDLELSYERSSGRIRDSGKQTKDRKHRDGEQRPRSMVDFVQDLEPMREQSLDRFRESVERDVDSRELLKERHHPSSGKRKDHDESEEDLDKRGKRARVTDELRDGRRERRRFGDRVIEDASDVHGEERMEEKIFKDKKRKEKLTDMEEDREKSIVKKEEYRDDEDRKVKREKRKFSDNSKVEEKREKHGFSDKVKEEDLVSVSEERPSILLGSLTNGQPSNVRDKSGPTANVVSREPLTVTSNVSITSAASRHPFPTKVSSITTTNENEGVSVIRSDEVPGKSSTDGTTASVAAKGGSLSLDALTKAKKALQMQKELSEKLKKITTLNKFATTGTANNSQAALNKDGLKVQAMTPSAPKSPVGAATSEKPSAVGGTAAVPGVKTGPSLEAVKRAQELAAKMGFRQDPEFAPLINMFPVTSATDAALPQRATKAPVLRLDAQGREVDEHGNIISIPKLTNLSTLKVNINKQKKEAFQILRPDLDADVDSNPHFDSRMGIDKTKLLRPKRMTFQFVEEGKWSKQAEIIKFKSQFGEAQAKELKTKQSQLARAKTEVDNPNFIELPDRVDRVIREKKKDDVPEIEWWDKPILPSGGYSDVANERLNMEKITIYVEHPLPIEPPAEPAPPPPQPLKLTKREQKKLRTQRRLAKEKDRQEMIRQGLLEPPKPKIKMTNLMKVLGSEATQDPTRLEMEIRSAAAEREQAHVDRNIARKLTPAERREKKERKLFEDQTTLETLVSVYKIKDLSHPQTRFKVDVNAQENRLSGVAVISDGVTVVVVEGGKKPIKRYGKLMLKRINWAAAVGSNEDEGDENADTPVNSCALVWQGSVAKPSFHRFMVHQCRTEAAAKKVFADAGVPHYWDLAINFTEELL